MSDSNEVRDYLLGRLPAAAAEDFEERFFQSDDLLRALEEEQQELIADYQAGALTAEDENAFRAQLARSSTLQEKVEMHRRLLHALERRPAAVAATGYFSKRRWLWVGAVAAGIAIAAGGVLLRRSQPVEPRVAMVAEPPPAPRQPSPAAADAVFFLSSGVTRGANSLPLLKVPASAKSVELQVELPASAETTRQWQLLDVDGREPGPASASATQQAGAEFYVSVTLPAEALANGNHSIRLQAHPGGSRVIVRSFTVLRVAGALVPRKP